MNEDNIVFMSIKEQHINRIISKTKNHEFRNVKPTRSFRYIFVYVPVPVKELKYILKVKQPVVSPNKINYDGIGNKEFNSEQKTKYAYPIENLFLINNPIQLDELKEKFDFTAPQSFAYGNKYEKLVMYVKQNGITKIY